MRVALQDAEGLAEQLAEPRVRENLEPVVARRLAVLQPRRRADRAMLLERLVGRIGDQQIDRFRRLRAQPLDGVERREIEQGWGTFLSFLSRGRLSLYVNRLYGPGVTGEVTSLQIDR